jgi:hypothetical protein
MDIDGASYFCQLSCKSLRSAPACQKTGRIFVAFFVSFRFDALGKEWREW